MVFNFWPLLVYLAIYYFGFGPLSTLYKFSCVCVFLSDIRVEVGVDLLGLTERQCLTFEELPDGFLRQFCRVYSQQPYARVQISLHPHKHLPLSAFTVIPILVVGNDISSWLTVL